MRPLFHSVVVFVICIVSLSVGNVLLKMGTDRYGSLTVTGVSTVQAFLKSPQLPLGILLMIIQFIGTLTLFKWGWDASVVIPATGLCYVGMAILGKWVLGEQVGTVRWFGTFLIVAGVFFVARSAKPS